MTEEPPKRRRFPRIEAAHVVLVSKAGLEDVEEFAKMQSLGLGGCMFRSNESLGRESIVELLVSIGSRVVPAKARVVYELPVTGGGLDIGVEFLQLDVQDREFLATFVDPTDGQF